MCAFRSNGLERESARERRFLSFFLCWKFDRANAFLLSSNIRLDFGFNCPPLSYCIARENGLLEKHVWCAPFDGWKFRYGDLLFR